MLDEFRAFLKQHRESVPPQKPLAGVSAMSLFYGTVRFPDVEVEDDGDMLVFQWGTYDWGEGAFFEVDATRQLIREVDDDQRIDQLHLTYRFAPSAPLSELGSGEFWCTSPTNRSEFEAYINNHVVLQVLNPLSSVSSELSMEADV
ncbi:MAG: hypothetical protein RLN84_01005 [Rhodospirillaceae bacterium]